MDPSKTLKVSVETVKPRRVFDEDPVSYKLVGYPIRQQVQQVPSIKLPEGHDFPIGGWFMAMGRGMGPVRSPYQSIWTGTQQCHGKLSSLFVVLSFSGQPVGARELYPTTPGSQHALNRRQSWMMWRLNNRDFCHVVKYHIHR